MDFRPMTASESALWYDRELCAAFTPQECKPLADIWALCAAERYELLGLFDGGALIGYAALWKAPGVPLLRLDYLGVTARRRNGGLGAELLSRLMERKSPIVLESELPVDGDPAAENDLRQRRIGFYRRNGFAPCYRMATCGMAWQAMLFDPGAAAPESVMAWHRALYGHDRTDVRIPLPDGVSPDMPYWMK